MKRKELSDKIIQFLVEQKYEDAEIIKEQYENAQLDLQEDNADFFIIVKYHGEKRTSKMDYEINDIGLKYPNTDIGVTIFIRDGKLDMLEAYTYGDQVFPSEDNGEPYKIEYVKIEGNKEEQ